MSSQVQIDTLAYGSRMVDWAPLGKLFFVMCMIITGLVTDSIIVPMITFVLGLVLMAYSTNLKIPRLIGLAIGEAMLILILGCGMVSIMGSGDSGTIWETGFLWFDIHITHDSFNYACLIFMRAVAGVTLMLAFASSTPIPHLAHALRQVRIPAEITEIVVLIYRYSFLLLERMETMWSAAQCRLGFNGFRRTCHTVAGIAVGMFITSTEMANKAQGALECRNYQGYFPIFRMPNRMSVYWVAVSAAAAVSLYVFGILSGDWLDLAKIIFGVA